MVGLLLWWHDAQVKDLSLSATASQATDSFSHSVSKVNCRTPLSIVRQERTKTEGLKAEADALSDGWVEASLENDKLVGRVNDLQISAEKWSRIAPLASDYTRIKRVSAMLESFVNNMTLHKSQRKGLTGREIIEEWLESTTVDNTEFDKVRPKVVRIVTDMMSRYGLSSTDLTHEIIAGQILTSKTVQAMAKALDAWATILGGKLADEALDLL